MYINDLDDNITNNVLKFADDTKVFRKVNNDVVISYIFFFLLCIRPKKSK